jgi:response regulator RpfG family c-di-GMP phosphodiesterase
MDHKIDHSVLVVDDEELVAKNIERLLGIIKVKFTYASNGEDGLAIVKKAKKSFSIIISDQRMPGMRGHEFLEKVKETSPDTLRFLITGYSDMDAIIDAVNKGAIHRYIAKPWDAKDFLETIKAGLKKYELVLENEHFLKLAKKNNAKLYSLNCDLREKAKKQNQKLEKLDNEIKELNMKIETAKEDEAVQELRSGEKAEQLIKDHGWMNTDKIRLLYIETVKELLEQFHEFAARNKIKLPDSI